MKCPSCRTPLVVVERESIELDWCVACRGLWFDDGELELLAEKTGRRLDPDDVGRADGVSHGEKLRHCPRCDRKMSKALVGKESAVLVDRCEAHGLFLDAGELGSILSQLPEGATSDEAVIVRFLGESIRTRASSPLPGNPKRG